MLYHYTDFTAFDGIIRCAELRLNNILNMNDASEMRLFMNGICKAVIARLKANGETPARLRDAENFFRAEMEKEFYYSAYAACFSKFRDDASQWERYGHYGQGVCIAFHEDMMEKMTGGAISLQEVYYQEDMGEHRLVEDFFRTFTASEELSENLPKLQNLMITQLRIHRRSYQFTPLQKAILFNSLNSPILLKHVLGRSQDRFNN